MCVWVSFTLCTVVEIAACLIIINISVCVREKHTVLEGDLFFFH